jgi:hypothetical protein
VAVNDRHLSSPTLFQPGSNRRCSCRSHCHRHRCSVSVSSIISVVAETPKAVYQVLFRCFRSCPKIIDYLGL